MEKYTDDLIDEDIFDDKLEEHCKYQKKLMDYYGKEFLNRKYMLSIAKQINLNIRSNLLRYRTPLDCNGKPLGFTKYIKVNDLSIKHMENILKWAGFEYLSNSDLLLHTIHEQLIQKKWSR